MRALAAMLIVVAALGVTAANAQTAAAPAATTLVKAEPPGVFEVAGARVNQVAAAGVQLIAATPSKGRRAITVQSPWGFSYFDWPKNVTPVEFTIEVGYPAGRATINAPGYSDATKADYRAAIEAVVPHAIKVTQQNRAYMQGSGR